MDKGTIISGAGHAGVILWVMFGGLFLRPDHAPEMAVTEVSLLSSAEFDALVAAAPTTPEPSDQPAKPVIETPVPVEPEADVPPAPEVVEETPPATEAPTPEPAPAPDAAPDLTELGPIPEPEVLETPEPPSPVEVAEQPLQVPDFSQRPKPRPAPRVAPLPAEAPAPDATIAEVPTPAVTEDPTAEEQIVEEERPEAAPEEATTEIVIEATETEEIAALPPTAASRPKPRPAAAAEPAPEPAEDVAPAPAEEPATDSVAEALAEALAAELAAEPTPADPAPSGAANAPVGPPMTSGEKDALRVAVQACWNVGSLSTEALRTTVTVAVSVAQNGVPDASSIRMVDYQGGSDTAARQAYEAARRAVIRCGANGFNLPPEKYDQWRELELVFNPEGMRMK